MWSYRIKEQQDGTLVYEVVNPAYPDSTIRGFSTRKKAELEDNLKKTIKRLNTERGTELPTTFMKDE